MGNTAGNVRQVLQFPVRQYIRALSLLACEVLLSSAIALPVRAADETLPSLCGVPLGTRTSNRSNPLDRASLVGRLGSPTAVLVPMLKSNGKREVAGMTALQRPPSASSDLLPNSADAFLPHWAQSVALSPTPSQVEWLYNRMTYAMGFEVNRQGLVDSIIVSGIASSPQLSMGDGLPPMKLGDDFRNVASSWGTADVLQTYPDKTRPNISPDAPGAHKIFVATYNLWEQQQSYTVTFTARYGYIVRIRLAYGPDIESTNSFPKPRPLVIN